MSDLVEVIGEEKEKEPTHVDKFIAYGSSYKSDAVENERYARYMLDHFRRSATQRWAFDEFYEGKKLFCKYEGKKYRVIGASRLGDVWLTSKFKSENGYEHRVTVDDCSEWSKG